MKIIFLMVIFIHVPILVFSQTGVVSNYKKAYSVLIEVNDVYHFDPSNSEVRNATYAGTTYTSGHFSHPEMQYENPINVAILSSPTHFAINKDLLYEEKHYFSQFLLANDSCYTSDYWSDDKWKELTTKENMQRYYLPLNLVSDLNKNKHSLHYQEGENSTDILGFNDHLGNKYYVTIDGKTRLILKIIRLDYDQIYGDIIREIRFENTVDFSFPYPNSILEFENNFRKESLTIVSHDSPLSALDSVQLELNENESIIGEKSISCEEIAPGLYLVKLFAYGNKILVSEHDNYLSIFDAPGNIHVGNELISFLNKKFSKSVKYCFVSHHHPDHSGAVAAFNNIGAEIITTEKNVPFFKKICSVDHTIGSPNLIVNGEPTDYVVVDSASNKTFFKKDQNEVISYEIGEISKHTDEYLIFYFPKNDILFVPDLVFFPEKGIRDQKQRAYSVYETIIKNKLKVSKIYTGWPLDNYKDYGTMDDLKQSLKKNFPTIK